MQHRFKLTILAAANAQRKLNVCGEHETNLSFFLMPYRVIFFLWKFLKTFPLETRVIFFFHPHGTGDFFFFRKLPTLLEI